jgi:UPF0176 protein
MIKVAALYRFTAFADPASLRAPLLAACEAAGVRGTLLLAREGINGTIAGSPSGIAEVLTHIRNLPGCSGLDWKESTATGMPFGRMKVRLKREIVTMGEPDIDPRAGTGNYVAPEGWNALISAPDVVVIDTRNDYEVAIGTFEGAIDPGTKSFREFPQWWRDNAARFGNKRVAMFCTGGIRCEKSTNFLLKEGVSEVYHLKGGILKYLEDVPATESLWQGECFVFDQRVSVGHGLKQGQHEMCHACRRPIGATERAHPDFEAGVACPACKNECSEAQRERFRERQRQMELAGDRGDLHLGQRLERAANSREKRSGPTSDQS